MQAQINVNTLGTIVGRDKQAPVTFGETRNGKPYAAFRVVIDRRPAKNEPLSDEQAKRNLKGQWVEVITTDQTSIKVLAASKQYSSVTISGEMQLDVASVSDDKTYRANRILANSVRFVGGSRKPKTEAQAEASENA